MIMQSNTNIFVYMMGNSFVAADIFTKPLHKVVL